MAQQPLRVFDLAVLLKMRGRRSAEYLVISSLFWRRLRSRAREDFGRACGSAVWRRVRPAGAQVQLPVVLKRLYPDVEKTNMQAAELFDFVRTNKVQAADVQNR
jgi:hypothetical protein